MTEEVRANEIFARIFRGNQAFNVVLSAGIRGILLLMQHLYRLRKEKLLSGGEVESFEKFLKATGGKFDIINVPVTNEGTGGFDEFKKQLDERKVRFHMLPDLDEGDGRVQICVYQPDAQRFAGCFKEYIRKQLTGGEMVEGELMNLTDGRSTLVSVPGEEKIARFREDFDRLKINYAIMPDLKVGDGQIQILVANNDLGKMRYWYGLYQEDMLRQGKHVGDLRSMTMDEYQATAEMQPEEYAATSTEEMKERLQKYEGLEKGDFEKAVDALEDRIGTADSPAFQKYLRNREYEMLSVDHETLVEGVDPDLLPEEERQKFICRIPGGSEEDTRYLAVPKGQVFWLDSTFGDRYLTFIKADEAPAVYESSGKRTREFVTGKSLMEHFEKVKEKLSEKEMEQTARIAAKLVNADPVPNPVLSK